MDEILTNKQHLFNIRNMVSRRIIEARVNIIYFYEAIKKYKKTSQEMVDARNSIVINEQNIKKDTLFLKCIDQTIKIER